MPKGKKGFQRGREKTGGKVKGCKHKINRDIVGLLDQLKCNPIEGLARIAIDPKIEIGIRMHAYARIAKYVHPELKSIELSGPGGAPIQYDASDDTKEFISRIAGIASRIGPKQADKEPACGASLPAVV